MSKSTPLCHNSLHTISRANKVNKAFGIKTSTNAQTVLLAANAGFDSLFIDLEHGWLAFTETSNLCLTALLAGITPIVRVPHQCGNGFVQRVMDGGAMGVIFPHIHSAADAEAAVRIMKYPPLGCRSMTGTQPLFRMKPTPVQQTISICNESGSSVIAMIESRDAVEAADEIAAVEGVEMILVGSSDLSIDLGVAGQFRSETYRNALQKIADACRNRGKILGLAGVYDAPDIHDWAINTLGVRYMLVAQDGSVISSGGAQAIAAVPAIK